MSDAIATSVFGSSRTASQEIALLPGGNSQVFERAVIIQTLCDPSLRDEVADAELLKTLKNPKEYIRAPRNSVICRLLSQGGGKVENSDYPSCHEVVGCPNDRCSFTCALFVKTKGLTMFG